MAGRDPELNYTLTEDAYNRYERLLAEQGVTARPMRRETNEMLDSGVTSEHSYGALSQGNFEFPYTITRTSKGLHSLTVEPFHEGSKPADAILEALGRAFPQPERGLLRRPRPERLDQPGTFFQNLGCLCVVLFFVAVCVFAVIGAVSVFK